MTAQPAPSPRMSQADRDRRNLIRQDIADCFETPAPDPEEPQFGLGGLLDELRALEAEATANRKP